MIFFPPTWRGRERRVCVGSTPYFAREQKKNGSSWCLQHRPHCLKTPPCQVLLLSACCSHCLLTRYLSHCIPLLLCSYGECHAMLCYAMQGACIALAPRPGPITSVNFCGRLVDSCRARFPTQRYYYLTWPLFFFCSFLCILLSPSTQFSVCRIVCASVCKLPDCRTAPAASVDTHIRSATYATQRRLVHEPQTNPCHAGHRKIRGSSRRALLHFLHTAIDLPLFSLLFLSFGFLRLYPFGVLKGGCWVSWFGASFRATMW